MTLPKIRIHDTETDKIIDREMNAEEYKDYQNRVAEAQAVQAEIVAKSSAAEKLIKLGLTEAEVKSLNA